MANSFIFDWTTASFSPFHLCLAVRCNLTRWGKKHVRWEKGIPDGRIRRRFLPHLPLTESRKVPNYEPRRNPIRIGFLSFFFFFFFFRYFPSEGKGKREREAMITFIMNRFLLSWKRRSCPKATAREMCTHKRKERKEPWVIASTI